MEHHLALFDDLIHTPLIVRYPCVVSKGKRIKRPVQIRDWLPTFLDLIGIDDPAVKREMQGVSLIPTWDEHVRDFIIAEYQKPLQTIERALRRDSNFDYRSWLRRIKTIRNLEWKYVWYSDSNDVIFDIRRDPDERSNLVEEEKSRAFQMRNQLEKILRSLERRDYGDKMRNHSLPGYVRPKERILLRSTIGLCKPGITHISSDYLKPSTPPELGCRKQGRSYQNAYRSTGRLSCGQTKGAFGHEPVPPFEIFTQKPTQRIPVDFPHSIKAMRVCGSHDL